jgi:hypothetical protein
MKKNQHGFSVVELFFILVVLSIVGFIGWKVYQKSQLNSGLDAILTSEKPTALLFAKFDGLSVKVDSYDLDNGQKKQLLEQAVSEPKTRSSFSSVLDAKISPDKQLVAYRFGSEGRITVMKSDGTVLRNIGRSDTQSFDWLPNKKQVIAEVSNDVSCNNCGASAGGSSSDWYVYDVDGGKESKLDTGDNGFNNLAGQSSDTLYFGAYGLSSPPKLYAYNADDQRASEVKLPDEDHIQIGFIASSPNGKRTLVSLLPPNYGMDYKCTIYELKDNKLGRKLIDEADYQCENAYWVNDNGFYFDNSTGLHGKISTSDLTPSGYYILSSVYSYSFSSHTSKKVLAGNSSEVYRLVGALPDNSFIVSNEVATGNPQHKLEIRNANGSLKTSVEASPKEVLFIGSVH